VAGAAAPPAVEKGEEVETVDGVVVVTDLASAVDDVILSSSSLDDVEKTEDEQILPPDVVGVAKLLPADPVNVLLAFGSALGVTAFFTRIGLTCL